jgi:hypothetical protein
VLSTVDNNAARHTIQEGLPYQIVEGATNASQVSVSTHNAVDGRPCLVCLHPDQTLGSEYVEPLGVADTASRLGLTTHDIESSRIGGAAAITDGVIDRISSANLDAAKLFQAVAAQGGDVCGALGEFRRRFGITHSPQEPSIGFASFFAGVNAAAEAAKFLLVMDGAAGVPLLRDRVQLDMLRMYTRVDPTVRHSVTQDCSFCVQRRAIVTTVWASKWGSTVLSNPAR